jgi:hypothetical protein
MTVCPFKKYKDALGIVGKGVHKYRFLNTAIVDYILTILVALVLGAITGVPIVLTTIFSFILAIALHILFGVETNAVKYLGIKC